MLSAEEFINAVHAAFGREPVALTGTNEEILDLLERHQWFSDKQGSTLIITTDMRWDSPDDPRLKIDLGVMIAGLADADWRACLLIEIDGQKQGMFGFDRTTTTPVSQGWPNGLGSCEPVKQILRATGLRRLPGFLLPGERDARLQMLYENLGFIRPHRENLGDLLFELSNDREPRNS